MTEEQKDTVRMTGTASSSDLRRGTYTMVTGNYWKHGANPAQYTSTIFFFHKKNSSEKTLDFMDQITAQRWEMGTPTFSWLELIQKTLNSLK